jgi:glycerol-3-phosphate acyltransferase PlsY
MLTVVAIVAGYLIGSIPFAYLLSRRRGIDLRAVGSRNVGAANVLRTTGALAAIAALSLDAAKGYVAVAVAWGMTAGPGGAAAAGVASILGHVYTPWLGFRGGKGVATGAGVFALLAPAATAIAALVFVLTVVTSRFVSAGSVAASVALAVVTLAGGSLRPVQAGALAAALIIVLRHRGNLARLVAGTERPLGERL